MPPEGSGERGSGQPGPGLSRGAAALAGGRILGGGSAPRRQRPSRPPPPAPPPAAGCREGPEHRPGPRLGCQAAAGASSRRNGASHAGARSHGVRRVFSSRRELRPGTRGGALLELWTPPCFPPCLVTFMACHGGKAEERKARFLPAARFLPPCRSPATAAAPMAAPAPQPTCPGGIRSSHGSHLTHRAPSTRVCPCLMLRVFPDIG